MSGCSQSYRRRLIKFSVLIALIVALFSCNPKTPLPATPRDPNYKLPEKADVLPPEQKILLLDILSRIQPAPYDAKDVLKCAESEQFAKKAFHKWNKRGRRIHLPEDMVNNCKSSAIAAINLNYFKYFN